MLDMADGDVSTPPPGRPTIMNAPVKRGRTSAGLPERTARCSSDSRPPAGARAAAAASSRSTACRTLAQSRPTAGSTTAASPAQPCAATSRTHRAQRAAAPAGLRALLGAGGGHMEVRRAGAWQRRTHC